MQRFLTFLPGDGQTLGAGGESLALIEEDIEYLLTVPAEELWALARTDASLFLLVASFLQYARCCKGRHYAQISPMCQFHSGKAMHVRRCAVPPRHPPPYRRPYDEGFHEQSATEASIWQRMLPLLHRL